MIQKVGRNVSSARSLYPGVAALFVIAVSVLVSAVDGRGRVGVLALAAVAAFLAGRKVAGREEALALLCTVDPLTRLHNRRHFEQSLLRELANVQRHAEPLTLLVVDVDGLKKINDLLGHHAGDAAIRVVADALRGTCRASDVCARWGGDEFVVLAPRTDEEQALALIERINTSIPLQSALSNASARLHQTPSVPSVTASIGFAVASANKPASLRPDLLFAAADKLMYRRKSARRVTGPLTGDVRTPASNPRLPQQAAISPRS